MENTRTENVIVTPGMAENWLNRAIYERQRKRADWHVKRLAIEMREGRFIVGTQIHFGILKDALKLVNGQHTLAAIAQVGKPIELTVLYTNVDDEKELGQLYGRHDRHRGRTPHDAFLGMAAIVCEESWERSGCLRAGFARSRKPRKRIKYE